MVLGKRIDPDTGQEIEVKDLLDHFYKCKHCGQYVDMRDLSQVMHHNSFPHEKIKTQ
jgi:hypothetical protein